METEDCTCAYMAWRLVRGNVTVVVAGPWQVVYSMMWMKSGQLCVRFAFCDRYL